MANFNKSFNFRGGFQVDEKTFIVRGGNVGIGSSIPSSRLDVDGTITAQGLNINSEAAVGIESATFQFLDSKLIHSGVTSISSGIITATSPAGIVTYYGDARFLQGLPTSQWIDTDIGLGYTSIYASGNVGVDTTDPRYAFQVGGVPFPTTEGPSLPAQDGVGIERGNVYVSGIVSTRGEFIGLGSNITAIDASNISSGVIGSMVYGPLIVTEEVIADRFTGIASTALSVTTDAILEFDSATANEFNANEFNAVNRFVSTAGKLQIGDDSTSSAVGDIDVFKTGSNSSVYSLSDRVSKLFVGTQRQSGSARQFGGLRHGLVGSDPLTQINDLDLVNYDIGNLNFYLHSGSGGSGITTGAFRWIYGQTDASLAELSKEGVFSLKGNGVPGSTVLEVAGISSFSDAVYIGGDLSVAAGNSIALNGDVNFGGAVDLSSATITYPAQITLEELLVTDSLTIGNPLGDTVTINGTEVVVGLSTITRSNIITPVLNASTVTTESVVSNNITFNTNLSGTSFNVNDTGDLSASSISASSITASVGTVNGTFDVFGQLTTQTLESTISITTPTIGADSGQFATLNTSGAASINSLTVTNTSLLNTVTATGSIDSQTSIAAPIVTTGALTQTSSGGITLNGTIVPGSGSGISNLPFVDAVQVTAGELFINGYKVELQFGQFITPTFVRVVFTNPTFSNPNGFYAELPLTPV